MLKGGKRGNIGRQCTSWLRLSYKKGWGLEGEGGGKRCFDSKASEMGGGRIKKLDLKTRDERADKGVEENLRDRRKVRV